MGSEVNKNNMSMILENQAKQLVVEQSSTQTGGMALAGGQGAQWAGVALPLVRKVFGQIAAKEFVSVQPMNLPSGLVFFLDFQYGQDKELNFGPGGNAYSSPASMYGNTNPGPNADPSDGLYGAGRFGYSVNQFSASVDCVVATGSWEQLHYQAELSSSAAAGNFTSVSIDASDLSDPDKKGVRAFVISSGSTQNDASIAKLLPKYTEYDAGQDKIYFVFDGAVNSANIPVSGGKVFALYNKQPVDNARGDFEDAAGAGRPNAESTSADALAIPQIDVKMKSEAIVAKTRKLKAQWTPEFAQDLNAYQALDAEAELTSVMSEYISLEIDLEILDMLISDASAADEYWSAKNNQALNAAKTGFEDLGFFNAQGQWFQTLGTKLQKVSNKIHQKTLRGGANFMVISPSVATIIESIPGFASNADGDAAKMKFAFGIQKMGQMNSRYDVYKNPYMTEGTILMGYRGNQFLETGAVFAPYIPLIMTPLVYDPDTFTPRKGLLTRYAKKMIRPEFYGRVFVSNLELV
jgi:N-acetylmuramoyl-L-alanine amidase